jgi:hypothetical protein
VLAAAVMVICADSTGARQTGDRETAVAKAAFEASVRVRVRDRRTKCMNVIGHAAFCDCVSGSLPLDVDFQRYVAVALEREQSQDETRVVNAVLSTRNSCVASVFGPAAR